MERSGCSTAQQRPGPGHRVSPDRACTPRQRRCMNRQALTRHPSHNRPTKTRHRRQHEPDHQRPPRTDAPHRHPGRHSRTGGIGLPGFGEGPGRPGARGLCDGAHRPVDHRRAGQPGTQLPAVGRAAKRRRWPQCQRHKTAHRVDQQRRPQRHRNLRAHLRKADGQRQGRSDPAALGQQRQLRRRAAGESLRLPLPGAHGTQPAAGGDEAALLLPLAAATETHDGCAGGHAQGQRCQDHGRDLRRRPLWPGELRGAQGGRCRQRHQHRRGQELPAGRQGPEPGAAFDEGQEPRCLRRPDLPARHHPGQPAEQGDRLQPEVLLCIGGHGLPALPQRHGRRRRGCAGHGQLEQQDQPGSQGLLRRACEEVRRCQGTRPLGQRRDLGWA